MQASAIVFAFVRMTMQAPVEAGYRRLDQLRGEAQALAAGYMAKPGNWPSLAGLLRGVLGTSRH